MPTVKTKTKILDVAERLFAEQGMDGTSLREITDAAEVNLASVNYHFGSKEGLIQAAFARRVRPINALRLKLLAKLEETYGDKPIPIRELVTAYVRPVFGGVGDLPERDPLLLRLIGRLYNVAPAFTDPVVQQEYHTTLTRYMHAFEKTMPKVDNAEVLWRLHFMVGSIIHSLLATESLYQFSGGRCDPSNVDDLLERLIDYSTAGLCQKGDCA